MRLLIKLSYSESYTHADGRLLPLHTRLRLAVWADALDFVEALEQLVASLPVGLDLAAAAELGLGDLPPAVQLHPRMGTVRSELMALLVKEIEEREGKKGEEGKEEAAVVEAAVAALAKLLGPVEGMFDLESSCGTYGHMPLREHVLQLPLCVFKRLLACEALQMKSENETFHLLVKWVYTVWCVGSDDERDRG